MHQDFQYLGPGVCPGIETHSACCATSYADPAQVVRAQMHVKDESAYSWKPLDAAGKDRERKFLQWW